jgi:tetratricopeptide (TPR) repeat protein
MADYREFFAGQFLTGPECKTCPTFRIAEVRREEVEDPEKPQQRRQKLVVYGLTLQGRDRPWIVCKTSAILLAAMLGDDVDGWPGRAVTVGFDDTVTVDGKRVGGVRPIGAPDLPREMTVQVKLPRRKAKPHTLRPTGTTSCGPAMASSAAKLDPENPQSYNLLGLINMQIKEDAQAMLNFERALRLAGTDPDINNNYGWFLCERGRHAESIKFFMAAVRSPLYANVDRSLVNAGVCSRRRGDNAEAMRFFEQALGLRSNQPVALFNLADLSFASGRAQEARV